ncbi:hypothetical protein E2C01_048578 [Portunus trituberculatus]|uniref:Uncharacterized protein n=1 Tax=Portunus trituberculatus TaxID=210409 RepID=A0A5B7GBF5_PORTR|nr:hypothetical protein [Portunus trituberculatus]
MALGRPRKTLHCANTGHKHQFLKLYENIKQNATKVKTLDTHETVQPDYHDVVYHTATRPPRPPAPAPRHSHNAPGHDHSLATLKPSLTHTCWQKKRTSQQHCQSQKGKVSTRLHPRELCTQESITTLCIHETVYPETLPS